MKNKVLVETKDDGEILRYKIVNFCHNGIKVLKLDRKKFGLIYIVLRIDVITTIFLILGFNFFWSSRYY